MNKKPFILLVDDDADDRDVFCDILEEIDPTLQCVTAFDGLNAYDILNKTMGELPDLIFLDLNMPRLNGIQFLQRIKSNPKYNSIPVVIYSTSRLVKDIQCTRAMGAINFISKPTKAQDLKTAISEVLNVLPALKKVLSKN